MKVCDELEWKGDAIGAVPFLSFPFLSYISQALSILGMSHSKAHCDREKDEGEGPT